MFNTKRFDSHVILKVVACFMVLFAGIGVASATTYYVRTNGDDSCSGFQNVSYIENPTDCAWQTVTHALATITAGDTVRIQSGTYYESPELTHSGTSNNLIQIIGDGNPILDGESTRNYGFYPGFNSYYTFDGFTIQNYTDTGIRMLSYGNVIGVSIVNCTIKDITKQGIFCDSVGVPGYYYTDVYIYNNSISNIGDDWLSNGIIIGGDNVTISHNIVENINGGGMGIQFGGRYCTVEYNHLKNVSGNGIDSANGHDNTVKNNYIHCDRRGIRWDIHGSDHQILNNVIAQSSEAAMEIYGHNDRFLISGNTFYEKSVRVKGGDGTIVENNTFYPGTWFVASSAIHDGLSLCTNLTFRNNYMDGCWLVEIGGGDNMLIENNIFTDFYGSQGAIFFGYSAPPPENWHHDMTIRNNVFHSMPYDAIDISYTYRNINISNNIFMDIGGRCVDNNAGENVKVSYNNVWNSASPAFNGVTDTNTIYQNPLFADVSNNDLHLKSKYGRWSDVEWVYDDVTSPCIDAGDPSSDYSNEPEPNGGKINMGAYGNTIESSKSGGPDTIPPTITAYSPTGTNISVGTALTATFSEAMNTSSAQGAFSISPSVTGSFSEYGNKMIFTPGSNLAYKTTYTVKISTETEDVAGNNLESPFSWQFTTMEEGVDNIYYVSLSGNDANNGNTLENAWRHIAYAATRAHAGDTILAVDGTYTDEHVVFTNSGTADGPITIKAYNGTPIIDGLDDTGYGFHIYDRSYINILGPFEILNYYNGVLVEQSSHVKIENLRVYDIGTGIHECCYKGISLEDGTNYSIVNNCVVHDTGWNNIMIYADDAWGLKPCYNNSITNCEVYNSWHSGIDIHTNVYNTLVEDNVVHDALNEGGIYIHNYNIDNTRVLNNTVYNCYWSVFLGGGINCTIANNTLYNNVKGIDFDWSDNNIIEGNHIYSNDQHGIELFGSKNNLFTNNDVDDAEGGYYDYYLQTYDGVTSTNNIIRNIPTGTTIIRIASTGNTATVEYTDGRVFSENSISTPHWFPTGSDINLSIVETVTIVSYNITAVPISDYTTVTLNKFDTSLPKGEILVDFTADTTDGTNVVFTVGDLTPGKDYLVKRDGVNFTTEQADLLDYIEFSNSGWSARTFTVEETTSAPGTDPIGLWHFDEGSGIIAVDSSRNGNNGSISGATWTTGKLGFGLQFDGVDDYVEVPDSSSLNSITDEITLIAWIKTPITGRHLMFERWLYGTGVNERSFEFDIDTNGAINFALSSDGTFTNSVWLKSSGSLAPNTWTHLAATSNGTTMNIYINGEQDPNTATAPSGGIHSSVANLHIGRWEYNAGVWSDEFNGVIDEVKIHNRALSEEEILADYEAGLEDTTPPICNAHLPTGTNVPVGTVISTTFSEPMNTSSAEDAFSFSPSFAGTFSWIGNTMTFTPDLSLGYETTYAITMDTAAVDLAGNHIESAYNWQFTTEIAPDAAPTSVTDTTAAPAIIPDDTDNDPQWGESTRLTVTVTDDDGIASVTIDLSAIGGPSAQPMANTGGNIWSVNTSAAAGTPPQIYDLRVNATNVYGHSNTSGIISLTVVKNGDINVDGNVDLEDVTYLVRHTRKTPGYEALHYGIADLDGDGKVDFVNDAVYLVRHTRNYPGFEILH